MSRHIIFRNVSQVPCRFLPEVLGIGKLGIRIDVGGKNTCMPVFDKSLSKAPDTTKEIYKPHLFHSNLHPITLRV